MLNAEFEFILKDKIEYAVGGTTKAAINITVKAPSYNDTKQILKLHTLVNQALTSYLSTVKEFIKNNEIKSDEVKSSHEDEVADIVRLLIRGNYDSDKLIDIFTDLILKTGKLDGKEPLTPFLLGKLSPQETLRLLGEYVVNFPLAV